MPKKPDVLIPYPEPIDLQTIGKSFLGLLEGTILFDPVSRNAWAISELTYWDAGVDAKPLVPHIPVSLQRPGEASPATKMAKVCLRPALNQTLVAQFNFFKNGEDDYTLTNVDLSVGMGTYADQVSFHDQFGNITGPEKRLDNGHKSIKSHVIPDEEAFAILGELMRLIPYEHS